MVPGLKNGVEVCPADMSWGCWVLPIVLHDEVQCFDIGGRLPRVVFSAEALPLDQELEPNWEIFGLINHRFQLR